MNDLDAILQKTCPTVMVPRFCEFEPITETGHRFLAAADGLWVEIRQPWLHLIWPVAQQCEIAMPYGTLEKKIDLAFGRIPRDLMSQFVTDATAALPNEHGAWLIWNDIEKRLEYRALEIIDASPDHLEVSRPDLADHESFAVDLHTHGRGSAFFSPDDNTDDFGEVKLSGVLGGLGSDHPSSVFRLCAAGKYISIEGNG